MSNLKVVNVVTGEEVAVLETKNAVAEFIAEQGVTENSVKTIQKKVKVGEVLYETFKIEEEEKMKDENIEVINDGVEVEGIEDNGLVHLTNENEGPEMEEIDEDVETVEPETNIVIAPSGKEMTEEEWLESDEALQQVEDENSKFEETIKGQSEEKPEEPAEEKKPNKRKVGKSLIAYKDGEEFQRFPSIKAAATFFKELKGLSHMPFTPIMKSARQDIDWNEYSFKFENEEDLHIPNSMKEKIKSQEKEKNEKVEENVEQVDNNIEEIPLDEVVEEIPVEEL